MIRWLSDRLKREVAPIRLIFIQFCMFWGIPCRLPLTRANDDLIFLRASNRAYRKALFRQRILIWSMITPIFAILILCPNMRVVVALLYLLPTFLVGAIGIIVGTITTVSGSPEIQTRNELRRLLQTATSEGASSRVLANTMKVSDVTLRAEERRDGSYWNIPESDVRELRYSR